MGDGLLTTGVAVLVVDDQPVFLRAARELIAATPGFEAIGEATSGDAALQMAHRLRPDLVLLDVRMPGMDGIETARRLAEVAPDAFVVLISLEAAVEFDGAPPVGVDAHVRKQDLSVRTLPELWAAARGAGSAGEGRDAAADERPHAGRRAQ
jgi:DNA-binding NarL/FixJ family response regulator